VECGWRNNGWVFLEPKDVLAKLSFDASAHLAKKRDKWTNRVIVFGDQEAEILRGEQMVESIGDVEQRISNRLQLLREADAAWRVLQKLEAQYVSETLGIDGVGERGIGSGFVQLRIAKLDDATEKADQNQLQVTAQVNVQYIWGPDFLSFQPLKRQLIQGVTGVGKTTLLKRIAYQWAKKVLWRDLFDVVVFLRLRDVPETKQETLEQLMSCCRTDLSEESIKLFCQWCRKNSGRVLWLLDEWDEVDVRDGLLLERIRSNNESGVEFLLAASRNECTSGFSDIDRKLVVQGFSSNGVREFVQLFFDEWDPRKSALNVALCLKRNALVPRDIRKLIPGHVNSLDRSIDQRADQLRRLLQSSPWLLEVCKNPSILAQVCSIVPKMSAAMRKSDIYRILIGTKLEKFVISQRRALGALAWKSFRRWTTKERLTMSMDEIEDLGENFELSGLLHTVGIVNGNGVEKSFVELWK
jgi:hypothetical protein